MRKNLLVVAFILCAIPARAQDPRDLLTQAVKNIQAAQALMGPPTVQVAAGGNVQAAIDAATQPGTVIQLQPGTYAGPVTLRGVGGVLTTTGTTVITAPDQGTAVLVTGANWTISNIEATGNCNDCILMAKGSSNVVIDHVFVHGGPTGAKNGITLNGANGTVRNSVIDDIYRAGQESHGIIGYDGPGPYTIENNFIRAASVNIMIGGADPTTANLVPSDISVKGNTITKRPEWKGAGLNIKNLFELKNARRVTVDTNDFSYSWTDGQQGYAIGFSPRNQGGQCPWCTVEDVTFTNNTITNVGAAFNILGTDDTNVSKRAARIVISNNNVTLCTSLYPGAQRQVFVNDGPDNLELRNNRFSRCDTASSINSFLYLAKPSHPLVGFVVSGNRFLEGSYGLFGESVGLGTAAWTLFAPGGTWDTNAVVDFPARNIPYPTGTTMVTE